MSGACPIRLGMVGGGAGAFIGAVHRMAARLDGHFTLVAGAFSSDPERSKNSGIDLGIAPDRAYPDYQTMAQAEKLRADGIEAVSIVTPNHMHFGPAKVFMEAGIDVICDKPVTATLQQAHDLAAILRDTGRLFILTHNYTGYPMVREARARVAAGDIGRLRMVHVEYPQGWLAEKLESTGSKQASWRTDPAEAGAGGALGDIGTHAFQLACFVTGEVPGAVLADLSAFGAGRQLDDNANVLLRFPSGARGILWVSQVAVGCLNGLRLRVYGEAGGLDWAQEQPNQLWIDKIGAPRQVLIPGGPGVGADAARVTRLPAGHPEGFLEAFATIYADAAQLIRARRDGATVAGALAPGVQDGLLSLAFVDACVRSNFEGASWVGLMP